jgi:hypothetical protein
VRPQKPFHIQKQIFHLPDLIQSTMCTEQSSLSNQQQIYRSVTADTSQIRDGRDVDSLRLMLDGFSCEPSEDEVKLCMHKVGSEGFAGARVIRLSQYRPARSRASKASLKKTMDASSSTLPTVAMDCSSSTVNPQAQEPSSASSLSLKRSKRHDDISTSLRKGKPIRRHSADMITSPYISGCSQYAPRGVETDSKGVDAIDQSNSSSSSSNKLKVRRKSEPHHRDQSVNSSLCSIMKTPKYSRSTASSPPLTELPSADHSYSKLLDISNHRFNLSNLSSSLPPSLGMGANKTPLNLSRSLTECPSRRGSITSIVEEEDEWLPRGVEFCASMEVYVFKVRT